MNTVNFYLPGFRDEFLLFNLFLADLQNTAYMYDQARVAGIYDSFPGMLWNGGRVVLGKAPSLQHMQKVVEQINRRGVKVRYAYSNLLLTENHLKDDLCRMSLEVLAGCGSVKNEVITASPLLENYLAANFPALGVCRSTTSSASRGFDFDRYDMVVLNRNKNRDSGYLKNLPGHLRPKVEISVNEFCGICSHRHKHYRVISQWQLDVNGRTANKFDPAGQRYWSERCTLKKSHLHRVNLPFYVYPQEIYGPYAALGYRNFKLSDRDFSIRLLLEDVLRFMIKPQYRQDIRSKAMKIVLPYLKMKEIWRG